MKVSLVCIADRADRLPGLVWSLVAQTHVDWELIVLDQGNGDVARHLRGWLASCTQMVRIVKVAHEGDWGQTAKNAAARELATGDVLMFPNDDAYYVPVALAAMTGMVEQGADLVVCGWLYDQMGYYAMPPSVAEGRVDVGGFMVTREAFNKVEWNDRSQVGDAKLIAALIASGARLGKYDRVLYVKN